MGDQPRIAAVGSTMIDLVPYTARVPHAGETIQGHRDGFVISGVP